MIDKYIDLIIKQCELYMDGECGDGLCNVSETTKCCIYCNQINQCKHNGCNNDFFENIEKFRNLKPLQHRTGNILKLNQDLCFDSFVIKKEAQGLELLKFNDGSIIKFYLANGDNKGVISTNSFLKDYISLYGLYFYVHKSFFIVDNPLSPIKKVDPLFSVL